MMNQVFNNGKKDDMSTKKVILTFPAGLSGCPVTWELIREHDVKVNILKAGIEPGREGTLLVELEAEDERLEEGLAFLRARGVGVEKVRDRVSYDRERCINCGNCASACFSGALTIGPPTWELAFDPERCIACKLCLKACPLKLFRVEFADAN